MKLLNYILNIYKKSFVSGLVTEIPLLVNLAIIKYEGNSGDIISDNILTWVVLLLILLPLFSILGIKIYNYLDKRI